VLWSWLSWQSGCHLSSGVFYDNELFSSISLDQHAGLIGLDICL